MATGRKFPRSVRKAVDPAAIARAVRSPGIDPRIWVAFGTVGTTDEQGNFSVTDTNAVYVAQDGVLVDCQVVTPSGEVWPITARFNGISGGSGLTIYSPIRPGDEVLVVFAGGSLDDAYIIARMNNDSIPIAGDDSSATTPTWNNDRLVIKSTEPLQFDAPAISMVGLVTINGRVVTGGTEDI